MTACVFAALAALVHVYIFVLESVRWRHPATRKVFGTSEETAAITAPLAHNQGFYKPVPGPVRRTSTTAPPLVEPVEANRP